MLTRVKAQATPANALRRAVSPDGSLLAPRQGEQPGIKFKGAKYKARPTPCQKYSSAAGSILARRLATGVTMGRFQVRVTRPSDSRAGPVYPGREFSLTRLRNSFRAESMSATALYGVIF